MSGQDIFGKAVAHAFNLREHVHAESLRRAVSGEAVNVSVSEADLDLDLDLLTLTAAMFVVAMLQATRSN